VSTLKNRSHWLIEFDAETECFYSSGKALPLAVVQMWFLHQPYSARWTQEAFDKLRQWREGLAL
jgi:hypothetical protein